MDVNFPIEGVTSEEQLFEMVETGTDGFFPVGGNGFWHGGVHLRTTRPLVAVRSGVLVAYRINKLPLTVQLGDERMEYSTGFVLLRHELQTPLGHKSTFYSLTMHVLPWSAYREDPSLMPPEFISEQRPKRIKTNRDGRGVKLVADASPTTVLGILPKGAACAPVPGSVPAEHWSRRPEHRGMVRVRWNGLEGWAKLDRSTSREEPASLWVASAAVTVWKAEEASQSLGTIPVGAMFSAARERPRHATWSAHPRLGELYKVSLGELQGYADLKDVALGATLRITGSADAPTDETKLGLAVREKGDENSGVLRILPKGACPRFKDPLSVKRLDGRYCALSEGGFILVNEATMEVDDAIREPEKYDELVVPRRPVLVERGARLGYAGTFLRAIPGEPVAASPSADSLAHFEIFSADASFAANPHNEHWFGTSFRIPPGTTFKHRACAPDARPPRTAIALRAGEVLRRVHQNPGSAYAKHFRHRAFGWKRLSELGDYHPEGYTFRNYPNALLKNPPTCWCSEVRAETVDWRSARGDYLDTVDRQDVFETFKRVNYQQPEGTTTRLVQGWAREHALGDFHEQAYKPTAAVTSAITTRPTQWIVSTPSPAAVSIPIGRYVRHEEERQVAERFRRVRLGTEVGWTPQALLGEPDPRGRTYRPTAPVPFLTTLPVTSAELRSGRTIPAGSEFTPDGGEEVSVEEPWVRVFFRNDEGGGVEAWVRKAELGPVSATNIFILTQALPKLLIGNLKGEVDENANTHQIDAPVGAVLGYVGPSVAVKRSYQKVQQHGGAGVGWIRALTLKKNFTPAPRHMRLAADVSALLGSAPTQIELAAHARDTVTVLSEADIDGLSYLEISHGRKQGWCLRSEIGAVEGGRSVLTSDLRWILRDRPTPSPALVKVTAKAGDAVILHEQRGAFARVEVIVTVDAERCHGWYRMEDLSAGGAPRSSLTETLTDDPDSSFTVDAGVNSSPVKFDATTLPEVRTQTGHGWHEVEFQPGRRGWINVHIDAESRRFVGTGVSAVSACDWEGWQKLQEEGAEARFSDDGLCDVPTLVNLLEKDEHHRKRDARAPAGKVTLLAIRQALAQAAVKEKLRHLICLHPSEWDAGRDGETRFRRLKAPPWELDDADYNATLEYVRKLDFWRGTFGSGAATAPSSKVWHWHPISVLSQWRKMRGLTAEQIQRIVPHAKSEHIAMYIGWINITMERYAITTSLLQAHFLAQVAHESGAFKYHTEVYDGEDYNARFDLGNLRPHDGTTFRGRGLIQLTGRENYSLYGAYVGEDFTANPGRLATPRFAADAAGWFWRFAKQDLNTIATSADEATVRAVTRVINGGDNGIDERLKYFNNAIRILLG